MNGTDGTGANGARYASTQEPGNILRTSAIDVTGKRKSRYGDEFTGKLDSACVCELYLLCCCQCHPISCISDSEKWEKKKQNPIWFSYRVVHQKPIPHQNKATYLLLFSRQGAEDG